jgi:hypothetical protein
LTLLVVVLVVLALVAILPVGCDYNIFAGAARAWLRGDSRLYDTESLGFFYAPWSLVVFAPLSLFPDKVSSGLINAASILALLLAYRVLIGPAPWYVVVAAVSNIYTANLIGSTQWDALTTAAVALALVAVRSHSPMLLGLSLAFVGTKPTNVWLPMIVVLCGALLAQGWTWRSWLRAAVIPAGVVAASFVISGWDWLLRYISFVRSHPPNAGYNASFFILRGAGTLPVGMAWAAVGAAVVALVLSIRRYGLGGETVAVALVLNLMISPYTTIYHYVQMIPAVIWLGKRDALWTVGLYAASVAWVVIQSNEAWILPIYPVAVSGALALAMWRAQCQSDATPCS